ncbi:MAG: hypothetical protein FWE46_03350 [Coriobacteriia bacterium]|nr:hypothetical protein [Coriobacteriia bacterium]MCL2537343.1 hypothetical protein [Coriobacteriia bacterium]
MVRWKRVLLSLIMALLVAPTVFWLTSIAHAEFLTRQHGAEFANEYLQTGMIDENDFFRLLSYTDDTARVYYSFTNQEDDFGDILVFQKVDDTWILYSWYASWDSEGVAWPYLFHTPRGLFYLVLFGMAYLTLISFLLLRFARTRRYASLGKLRE